MFIISLRFLTSCLFCSGNAIQTLKSNDAVRIITVRGTSFPAAETHDVAAPTEQGLNNSYIINIPRLIGNLSFTFYNIRRKYGIGEFSWEFPNFGMHNTVNVVRGMVYQMTIWPRCVNISFSHKFDLVFRNESRIFAYFEFFPVPEVPSYTYYCIRYSVKYSVRRKIFIDPKSHSGQKSGLLCRCSIGWREERAVIVGWSGTHQKRQTRTD